MGLEKSFKQAVGAAAEAFIKEKALQTETSALLMLICALAMESGVDPERLVAAWSSVSDYYQQFRDLWKDLPREKGDPEE